MKTKKLSGFIVASTFVVAGLLSPEHLALAGRQHIQGVIPVCYGWVLNSELCDLAPGSANDALHALLFEDFTSAEPALEAQHALHSDSAACIRMSAC